MWKRLLEIGKGLFFLKQTVAQHGDDIKQLREDHNVLSQRVDRLWDTMQEVLLELRHTQERTEDSRRILMLEFQNEMLRFERRLPPARSAGG